MSVGLLNTCSGHSVKMGQEGFLFAIGMEQEQHTLELALSNNWVSFPSSG